METAHVGRKEKKKKRRKKGVGRGMEKKLGRQGFGPRGLSFKQSISISCLTPSLNQTQF
jgi:hypothetical protein